MVSDKDRRRYKRCKYKAGFSLSIEGNSFNANTVDFSIGGIGFTVEDTPPLVKDSIINLNIEDLEMDIKGRVAWFQKQNSYLRVGIEKLLISGNLKHYRMSNVILDLRNSNKTGILEINKDNIIKKIYIKNGDMIFATSNDNEDRLGELLLRLGKINLDQYNKSVDILKKTGKRQGTILVELGYLTPSELIWAVRKQVEEIILSLFQWEDGFFLFNEGPLPTKELITLKLSAANLIYRGIKKIDNLTAIKNGLPSMDTILYYSINPLNLFQDITLDKEDRKIFSLIDGKSTIEEIISISPLDEFQTMKTLYALLSTRIIEIKEEGHITDATHEEILKENIVDINSAFVEKVDELYKKSESKNYYDILGVGKNADINTIKKAFYKSAKEFHPDRHFSVPSEDIKNKLNTIFSKITEAYKILSNPKKRKEYDQVISYTIEKPKKSNIEIAKERFSEGINAFRRRFFSKAIELFGQASYLDSSNPHYYFHLGLALDKEKRYREAEKAFRNALKIDPFNSDYLAELGLIYLKLNLPLRAKSTLQTALKYNPNNKKAAEGLKHFNY